jgi:hypothetical protein
MDRRPGQKMGKGKGKRGKEKEVIPVAQGWVGVWLTDCFQGVIEALPSGAGCEGSTERPDQEPKRPRPRANG